MRYNTVAIIPARGGSKTVPRKNIRLLCGKPIIFYTIREALKSRVLDRVVVSTEDEEIAEISTRYGAKVIARPSALARDDTPAVPVLQHAINWLEAKKIAVRWVVVLQPTSPFRTVADIDGCVQKLIVAGCDAVVSVCEVDYSPYWMYQLEGDKLIKLIECEKIVRRQDLPKVYRVNGAVYVVNRDVIMKKNQIMGDDTRAFIMPPERSLDIDTEIDLQLADILMNCK